MSSGIDLRVSRSTELLASLQQVAADFAKREEQLTRDIRTRRHAVNRKLQDATGRAQNAGWPEPPGKHPTIRRYSIS